MASARASSISSRRTKTPAYPSSTPTCRQERGRERTPYPGLDVVLLPVLWLSRRTRAVFAAGGCLHRRAADRRLIGGDYPEGFRRRGFRGAAGDPVLPP